jgi:hypothetical protein
VADLKRETFMLNSGVLSRVDAEGLSMAQKFLLCKIMVDSRPSSRITFGWPEGHDLGEGGKGCLVSLESLDEMNEKMNFTSLNWSWLG